MPAAAEAQEWYDLYEDALQALRQRKPARAAELLERAIRKRPEPGQNVFTYGTNRIDRYHPYLRLAEAHLGAGNLEGARDALQRSEARGREPAEERASLQVRLESALRAQAPPVTQAQAPPATAPTGPLATTPVTPALPPATTLPLRPVPTAPAELSTPAPSVAPATGTLELRSDPPGASAFLGARFLGATPLRVELPAGTYDVTLRKQGTADQAFTVTVQPGRRSPVSRRLIATLAPSSPLPEAPAPMSPTAAPSAAMPMHAPAAQATPATRMVGERSGLPRGAGAAAVLAVILGLSLIVWAFKRREPAPPPRVRPRPAPAGGPITAATRATPAGVRAAAGPKTGALPPTQVPMAETIAVAPTKVSPEQERFGEYRLLEALGKGGMAVVFKAARAGEHVALKRPLPALLEDPEFRQRFLREAEIGRTLHHPNIIRIFERGDIGGIPYFTMELVRGETLQSRVRREGAFKPRAAAKVIAQVAEALDYAHLKGVVHRDLKPSNIMILEDGAVKVMDYGIARARRFEGLTVTGAFLGTPDYVAPETAEGKPTDARSDLYSLGVVFYEILTGKKPFVGDTPFATLRKHCTEPPTPPSIVAPGVPRELEAIILRLLNKEPADRYPSAEELLIELRDYLNRAA